MTLTATDLLGLHCSLQIDPSIPTSLEPSFASALCHVSVPFLPCFATPKHPDAATTGPARHGAFPFC